MIGNIKERGMGNKRLRNKKKTDHNEKTICNKIEWIKSHFINLPPPKKTKQKKKHWIIRIFKY